MAFDDRPDWIDEVMARGGEWDPPQGFPERVVALAIAVGAVSQVHSPRASAFDVARFLRYVRARLSDEVLGRLEGSAWVIRQYGQLLLR